MSSFEKSVILTNIFVASSLLCCMRVFILFETWRAHEKDNINNPKSYRQYQEHNITVMLSFQQNIINFNIFEALTFIYDNHTWSDCLLTACSESTPYFCSSTKSSGTIPLYFLIQNLTEKYRTRPARMKGINMSANTVFPE